MTELLPFFSVSTLIFLSELEIYCTFNPHDNEGHWALCLDHFTTPPHSGLSHGRQTNLPRYIRQVGWYIYRDWSGSKHSYSTHVTSDMSRRVACGGIKADMKLNICISGWIRIKIIKLYILPLNFNLNLKLKRLFIFKYDFYFVFQWTWHLHCRVLCPRY